MIVREVVKREREYPGLGDRIKAAQKSSGLSVEKVIRSLDLSRTYWNRLVKDEGMSLSIDLLRKIEKLFDVEFDVDLDSIE